MTKGGRVPTPWPQERLWTLSDDRRTVRLELPPSPEGEALPFLDFDAKAVDQMLDRLVAVRARMLPRPLGY